MSTHKHLDKICCVVLAITLLLTVLFMNAEHLGVQKASTVMGYEKTLFDTTKVHTINIIMDDWDEFTANCKSEEYYSCTVVIDNEAYKNVAIRGKGNTSLSKVDNDRYSYKIEFDHYDSTNTYYGLDKLCLNNIIQDNTYMKDYLTYQMMNEMDVASPLCSYAYITVNGEDWGLYLAVEGLEESFLQRNYGKDYGELYKPDSMNMGGGRGNGKKFDMDEFLGDSESENTNSNSSQNDTKTQNNTIQQSSSDNQEVETSNQMPDNMQGGQMPGNMQGGQMPGGQMPGNMQGGQMPGGQMPGNMQGGQMPGGQMPGNMQGEQMPGGQMPGNMQGGQMPDGQMPGNMQDDTTPTEVPDEETTASPDTTTVQSDNTQTDNAQGTTPEKGGQMADGQMPGNMQGGNKGSMTNGSDDVLLKYIDDNVESYSNIFDSAKTDITDSDKARLINSLEELSNGESLENVVDIDAVIRYFVVHNFVLNFDSYTGSMIHNYYLYEKDGQMQMLPWDYNLAFGGFQSMGGATNLVNYPIDSPVSGGNAEDRPMIAWIFGNKEYTELYHKYFQEFISTYFDSGYFTKMMDDVNTMISPYVEKDPTKFCTYEEFEKGITTLKEFCELRAQSVSAQLDGTIGSTSDTQKNNTLIDAGDIQINDMGSMGNMMDEGKDKFNGNTENQQTDVKNDSVELTDETPSEDADATENVTSSDSQATQISSEEIPDRAQGGFDTEQMQGGIPPVPDGENGESGNQMQKPDDNTRPNNNGQMQPQEQNTMSVYSWILIGIVILALVLGIIFAFNFKRRK